MGLEMRYKTFFGSRNENQGGFGGGEGRGEANPESDRPKFDESSYDVGAEGDDDADYR